ncbi:MAG: SDR family oxidoreductase [Gammaproteobacteria bacterium]|nr:SDR family oxidoreductase [Gammaproteobacteria bacterium]
MKLSGKDLNAVFIVGCGDIGRRVARQWQDAVESIPISGLVRSEQSANELTEQSIQPVLVDLDEPAVAGFTIPDHSLIYYFAPPPKSGITDPRMAHFLAGLSNNLPLKFIYLSTSGVYGNQQGQLIDEATTPNPVEPRAKRRYAAETVVRDWGEKNNVPVVILRVGGIYGPGRLPLKRIIDRVPMVHEHLAPATNRIHAEDLAQACVAAAEYGQAGAIYNISDGCETNMTDYFNQIADFFDLPRPPTLGWDEAENQLSAGMLSYLRESRRLDNRRMLKELKVQLHYPDLKYGLESCRNELENYSA